ncbi:transposase [Shouchella shacheensis]|uniref:transposase n=1 Tax=Shouchella shacheensis TaxID=1649580 RepID=UPI0009E9C300|nr:transposase [Shouchella shacheensis]
MKKYKTQEYRDYVAKLIVEEGRVAREVAYELELAYSTVCKWVAAYKRKTKTDPSDEKYVTPTELKKMEGAHNKKFEN